MLPELFERLAWEDAVVAVEQFVVGRGSMRAGHDGAVTRDLIGALQQIAPLAYLRTASEVKPWASDLRMAAAGLLEPTKQLRHARDAARHALFAAVADCGIPDPLSRRLDHDPYLPTPQEFLERPEPADDGDLIDPLVSIAASLAQLIDAMLYPLPGDAAAEEELAQNLRETAADLEDKLQAAVATLAQIEAVVKPSTSKLANAVRAELARWRGSSQRVLRPLGSRSRRT